MMEKKTKGPIGAREPRMRTKCKEVLELLDRIKKSDGKRKLNKLGEWMDGDHEPILTWEDKDLKYILK